MNFNGFAMSLRIAGILVGFSILVGVWLSCWPSQPTSTCPVSAVTAPSEAELLERIELAARYLGENCDKNGRFVYRRHRDRYIYYGKKYNLLRHAGTMYAMAHYHQHWPTKETADLLTRTAGYLRSYIEPVAKAGPETRAVWTVPGRLGMGKSGTPPFAKLGGSRLGLVALTSVESIAPGTIPLEDLRGLGHFIRFMQTTEGRFYSKFYAHNGYETKWISLYYPGEACLGLLMLYDLDPDPRWLDAATRGLGYLARTRKGVRNSKKNEKFNKRVGEVRIDYVQHALSAMMGYQEFLSGQLSTSSKKSLTVN